MKLRTVGRVGGTILVAIALVLAGRWSGHLGSAGQRGPVRQVQVSQVPSSHADAAHSRAPSSASGDASLTVKVRRHGDAVGALVIPVPPPAPEKCSPSDIAVGVGQETVVECRSANYGGPITADVTNTAVASVSTSGGLMVPRYFSVIGLEAGTTIVQVSYPHGPTTSFLITVQPAGV